MNYKTTPDKFQNIKITQITMSRKVSLSQRAVIHFEKKSVYLSGFTAYSLKSHNIFSHTPH